MKNKLFLLCLMLGNFFILAQKNTFQSQNLSERNIKNIATFSKAYGIVRHFHPSSEIENFNQWEEFILNALEKVQVAKSDKQLNQILEKLFKPLAPTIQFSVKNDSTFSKALITYQTDSIVYKKNISWGDKGRAAMRKKKFEKFFVSTFEKTTLYELKPFLTNPNKYIIYPLFSNTYLYLPQTLYFKNNTTQPVSKTEYILDSIKKFNVSDIKVRIGSIIIFSNTMQHFYPYKHILNIDTEEILTKYIVEAALCNSDNDFHDILQKMSYKYKDNHAMVIKYSKDRWEQYIPPFKVEEIEGKPLVVWIDKENTNGIHLGDEIITIDGVDMKTFFKNSSQLFSGATDGYIKFMTYWKILQGVKGSYVVIELKTRKGDYIQKKMQRTLNVWDYKNYPIHPNEFNEYKKNYYYVNMANIKNETLSFLMDYKFPSAKGIIFDIRNSNYHKRGKELLGHLTIDSLFSQPIITPMYYFPNQYRKNIEKIFLDVNNWKIPPQKSKYTDNIVFLFDNQMYSARETQATMIEHFNLGTTIGRQTGGTNGNTSMVKLFESYYFFFTGMEVFQYDGSTFHGVGVKPDIEVEQTLDDLLHGKDTFIEKAKEILK